MNNVFLLLDLPTPYDLYLDIGIWADFNIWGPATDSELKKS